MWKAVTSKAQCACFDSVCICWSMFRYPWCEEPLHPRPDFHVLTQCVFADPCSDTCVFADPCSDTCGVGSHYVQSQVCMFWLSVCLLIRVQIPVVWGAITSKARGTGRALLQVSPWTVLSMLLFLCLGWQHWVTSLAILCRPPWVMYTACLALHIVNSFTAILVVLSLKKRPVKVPNLKSLRLFSPFVWAGERISVKMHSVESRFVIRSSDILIAGEVCTFQHINFTGCGSEGVNPMLEIWVTTTAAAKLAKIRAESCWLGRCLAPA